MTLVNKGDLLVTEPKAKRYGATAERLAKKLIRELNGLTQFSFAERAVVGLIVVKLVGQNFVAAVEHQPALGDIHNITDIADNIISTFFSIKKPK